MKAKRLLFPALSVFALTMAAGCGGGSTPSNESSVTRQQGTVQLTTDWTTPEDTADKNMYALIRVSLWQGDRLYREFDLKPPTRGVLSYAELKDIPTGPLRLEAVARTSLTAPGATTASVMVSANIQPDAITQVSLAFTPQTAVP
jgi:hypothetical protein